MLCVTAGDGAGEFRARQRLLLWNKAGNRGTGRQRKVSVMHVHADNEGQGVFRTFVQRACFPRLTQLPVRDSRLASTPHHEASMCVYAPENPNLPVALLPLLASPPPSQGFPRRPTMQSLRRVTTCVACAVARGGGAFVAKHPAVIALQSARGGRWPPGLESSALARFSSTAPSRAAPEGAVPEKQREGQEGLKDPPIAEAQSPTQADPASTPGVLSGAPRATRRPRPAPIKLVSKCAYKEIHLAGGQGLRGRFGQEGSTDSGSQRHYSDPGAQPLAAPPLLLGRLTVRRLRSRNC